MKKGVIVTPEDLVGNDWIQRLKRFDLNTLGIHSGGGPNHDVIERLGVTATPDFRQQCRDAGIFCEYELHAAAALLPPKLFADVPQCFAMNSLDGKRTATANPCVTNQTALDIIRENARSLTLKLPSDTHRYYFWGADQANGFCHCPQCAPYSTSDLNLMFMNAVAQGVKQADPRGQAACLIYSGCFDLPEKVQPEDNIFFEFAPFIRCYQHTINDPDCSMNRKFAKAFMNFRETFGAKRIHILEYWLDSSLFSNWKKPAVEPNVDPKIINQDIGFYIKHGIEDITTFAVFMDQKYISEFGETKIQHYAQAVNRLHQI